MEFVNGKDDNPYMKWKVIQMFDTTNQIILYETRTYIVNYIYITPLSNIARFSKPIYTFNPSQV